MNRYEASIPRAACSIAAVAMTAVVFGIAVVLPATSNSGDERILAVASPTKAVSVLQTPATATPGSVVRICDDRPSTKANGAQPLSAT